MNKTAIKNFAIWARNKLIADVSYAARLIGITEDGLAKPLPQSFGDTQFFDIGTAEPYSISGETVRQRDKLIEVIRQKEKDTDYKTAYRYVMEEVAYTWFNRLIAIRFMEVNDYLPSHIRVLSSESGKLEPDLVTTPFDAELPFTAEEEAQISRLKQDNRLDELFRILFLKQCNALNEILPALFEKTKNYTELLLSLSVIDQDGVVYHLIHDIPEDDFNIERGGQVEIIGWLYQYYNTEPKAAAFAKSGKFTKEEIPAVTQLFTPDWIVRYMVENSLGRLWVEGHPDCGLKENWKYYLEEAQQEPEVQAKLAEIRKEYSALNLEDIKLIDPCMGSGHILVYAFDVLMQIYESAGYSQRDAAKSILENNLYGLDIDDRAYQLAYFAVMMKARQYNRRILNGENTCHVYAIQESNIINRAHLKYLGAGVDDFEVNTARVQLEGLLETLRDAKEYGSILKVENHNWELLRRFVSSTDAGEQITMDSAGLEGTTTHLLTLIDIAETMERKYDVVVTNPPYMGAGRINPQLIQYIKSNYFQGRTDLFAVFIKKCKSMTISGGLFSMVTMQAWMFQSSFLELRNELSRSMLTNLIHLGAHAFEDLNGEIVQTASFVFSNVSCEAYQAKCVDVTAADTPENKESEFLNQPHRYNFNLSKSLSLPGRQYAYWISDAVENIFAHSIPLSKLGNARRGLQTGDASKFIRFWYEMDFQELTLPSRFVDKASVKWVLENNGGPVRKWYNSIMNAVLWQGNGLEIKKCPSSIIPSEDLYFKPCITWNKLTTKGLALKYQPAGIIPGDLSPFFIAADKQKHYYCFALLNTTVVPYMMRALNPTITTPTGDVADLPVLLEYANITEIEKLVDSCVLIAQTDSLSFEESWEFKAHPLVCSKSTIKEFFSQWEKTCTDRITHLVSNEEELNRIFIDIYGLQDELTPEVEDKDVTVRNADLQRDIKSLLSYAVGCMFGRYSLDEDGLAYAGGDWDESKYKTFLPDADGILPITDEEYLGDDIVTRLCSWLSAVYGKETLEENLDFIAKALGSKGNSSREIIRSYFLKDFFKDHCKIYQKRPIYWLFDSGKQNGFKALIYLHRYTPDTIGNLRIDYLHKMQRVYESEINRMQDMMDHSENAREVAAASKRKDKLAKQLKECREYDEKISHLALSRIELDLDDGVKVNYRKLQTAQDGKFYEVLADSKNIMVKQRGKA